MIMVALGVATTLLALLACTSTALEAESWPPPHVVAMDPHQRPSFAEYYASQGRPALIRGGSPALKWPALASWSLDSFKTRLKDHYVQAKVSENRKFGWGCCEDEYMAVGDLVDIIQQPDQSQYAYFVGDPDVLGVKDDVGASALDAQLVADADVQDGGTQVRMWISSPNSVTPLHLDAMNNFFVQIHGRKKFILFDSGQWPHVYLYPKFHLQHHKAQVNLDEPDLARFPAFSHAQAIEVELEPGDVLFLPACTFHEVHSTTGSISVNVWSGNQCVERINKAWDIKLPLEFGNWESGQKAVLLTSLFVRMLILRVLPDHDDETELEGQRAREWISKVLLTRYGVLHSLGDMLCSLDVDVHPESGENRVYQEYRSFVNEHPPLLDSNEYFERVCRVSYGYHANVWLKPHVHRQLVNAVDEVAEFFECEEAEEAIKEIYLAHFVEDLLSHAFGESNVVEFLKTCVSRGLDPNEDEFLE